MTLVDTAPGRTVLTLPFQSVHANASTGSVVADAQVLQRSEELFFSIVHVTNATTGQLVALGEVTYRLLEPRHC